MATSGSYVRKALSDRASPAKAVHSKKTQQQNQVGIHIISMYVSNFDDARIILSTIRVFSFTLLLDLSNYS